MSEKEPSRYNSEMIDPSVVIYVEGLKNGFEEGASTPEEVLVSILTLYWEERLVANKATRNFITEQACRFPIESDMPKNIQDKLFNEVEGRYI